ncbi:MAG: FtsX-like permease family protein [Oscillospiraceae bacterium]
MRLYARLAAGGIRRNGRLYAPYILTCSLMAMMYYIVCFLSDNSMLSDMRGGDMLREMMGFGIVIMGIFAGIFLFYTNSFLIKQRKREFGLYNILGMGKRNIARIMTWETAMVYLISMILGAGAGILFSKLAELLAVRILSGKAQYEFSVSVSGLISMLAVFAVIFLMIYLNVLRQVFLSKPIELLHSESAGEKPPRANWFLAVLGAVLLGLAYYMAVTIEEPMTALLAFFGAVILVIIATYLLFIAGSVAICKALQKNRGYYYKTNHFISTSQMAYRMKRNGAGLASICILCTMVLVTLSSTICLYAGEEQMLYQRYPRDIAVSQYNVTDEEFSKLKEAISASLERHDITAENIIGYQYLPLGGALFGNKLELEPETDAISELTLDLRTVFVLPIEDYNRAYGENIVLSDGEAAVFIKGRDFSYDTLEISNYGSFNITRHISSFDLVGNDAASVLDSIYLFVKDEALLDEINQSQLESVDTQYVRVHYYGFDMDCGDDTESLVYNEIYQYLKSTERSYSIESRTTDRSEFMGMYGGMFFLGIIFGSVFILAAVLIMYYKQISEGYDDRARFDILRKVGMNDRDIRRAVNSQVLTVFFAPLIAAGVHMAFAFPMLTKLLGLFGMRDTGFLAVVTLICFGVFAAMYTLVYLITSRSYYRIVSSDDKKS